MKTKHILLGILVLVIIVIAAGFLFVNKIRKQALPDYNQNIELAGITGTVEVFRDSLGIPHIYAENEKDLYTTVGYVMSQDRLWQMDLLRRVTTGRLAEIFGPDLVDYDQLMRSLRMTEKSKKLYAEADPALIEIMVAFCAGVNQYIEDHADKLPPEFKLLKYKPEPWLPEHSINLIGYMAWDLSTGWTTEVILNQLAHKVSGEMFSYLIPDLENVQTTVVHPEFNVDALLPLADITRKADEMGLDVFRGSNNWAVSGSKSTTGMPLMANDMHLGLMVPGIWYQMHQVVPGKVDITGVVLPGQALIVAGHNKNIAWGFTNVMVDDLDFYRETIHPNDSSQYKVNGEWRKMKEVEEMILTSEGDTVYRTNRFTHRGPVVSGFNDIVKTTLSMRWIGNEESNEIRTIYLLNRASNWSEFREALRTFVSVNQNVVYADIEGNIGLQSAIGLPIRTMEGSVIYPGDTTAYDWQGIVPFEDLPYSFNPESGYVSSANNKTVGPDYPYYISRWFDMPYRMNRINQLLTEKEKLSMEDMKAIQADQTSVLSKKIIPVFLGALKTHSEYSELESLALEELINWDFHMSRESVAATLFEMLYMNTAIQLTRDQLGEELVKSFFEEKVLVKNFIENIFLNPITAWCDDINTDETEILSDEIVKAFKKTVADLDEQYGGDLSAWQWGKLHTFTIEHPMAQSKMADILLGLKRGPYEVGGSHHTVCPYSFPFTYPNPDVSGVDHGASHRHIFDLSNWDRSLTVIPTGTSGIPASKHFCDQTEMFVWNRYHRDYFSKEAVEANHLYYGIVNSE